MVKKGSREERDLVHMFWDNKFAAMRAPASGGATKKPLPDVLAGNGKKYLAIEVKTTTKDKIYIDSEKIERLLEFSDIFGAEPYIGIKFKYKKWLFVEPKNLFKTKSGNYRLDMDLAFEKGLDFDTVIGNTTQVKLI